MLAKLSVLGHEYGCELDMWSVACTLYEIWTGQILFKGRDNNEMLKLMLDVRSKPSSRFIKKGMFWAEHFTEDMKFKYVETDAVTKMEKITPIAYTKPPSSFQAMLLTGHTLAPEQRKHFSNFKDLLERMLMIDPDKRISVREALRHPFITDKM
eukprot:m.84275 g.84275  ORF g.84275 m.84275 type:complete len:154 (-) comp12743_c0_seq2:176-637(-)